MHLTTQQAEELRVQAPEWALMDDAHRIERTFRFRDFRETLTFVQKVGELAEFEGHHPDVSRIVRLTNKEDDMEAIISSLVSRFEKGSLSRRELVRGLAVLAAGGTAASAQEGLNFAAATIDHVSIQVADLKRSSEFYQKMFGFKEVSGEPARGILRLGNTRTLVSLNLEKPTATVDHFAIGIPRYNKDTAVRYFTERGVKPLEGNFAGFHVLDPDGIRVQISPQS